MSHHALEAFERNFKRLHPGEELPEPWRARIEALDAERPDWRDDCGTKLQAAPAVEGVRMPYAGDHDEEDEAPQHVEPRTAPAWRSRRGIDPMHYSGWLASLSLKGETA